MRRPHVSPRSPRGSLLTVAFAALCLAGPVLAQTGAESSSSAAPAVTSYAIKAAYLINFIRYTDWPEEPEATDTSGSPFVIGVVGDRALEDEILRVADTLEIRGRRIRVARIRAIRDLDPCHLVFFDAEGPPEDTTVTTATGLAHLAGRPTLTVSQNPDFLARGGMINLYRDQGTVRFEIAPAHAAAVNLILSSRLLDLARIVRPKQSSPSP